MDESVRRYGLGTYVIGCVLVPIGRCDEIRRHLNRRPPFHFSGADDQHKAEMLSQIGDWGLRSSGYFLRGLYPIGQEGARRLCLQRLTVDLRDWGVHDLVMESRRERQNTFDAISIAEAKRLGLVPDPFAFDWHPKAERLLSLADAIAGATRVDSHAEALRSLGTVIREVRGTF